MPPTCPHCQQEVLAAPLYTRRTCPVVNNVVFDTVEAARNCTTGSISLLQCARCGLVFNQHYRDDLVVYDQMYDSTRHHSAAFREYLNVIVRACARRLTHRDCVLEAGCGNGDFLMALSDAAGCRAVGYDNAYKGAEHYGDRVQFRRGYYRADSGEGSYDMLVLRHVLEHVRSPLALLRSLCSPASFRPGARLLIEVPSLEWILQRRAFYDITYEHCNYFTAAALVGLAVRAGFTVDETARVFGGQYHLLFGIHTGQVPPRQADVTVPATCQLDRALELAREELIDRVRRAGTVCVWGASGKGVVFLNDLPDDALDAVKHVVDINPAKQGKFLPGSGKMVEPPEVLLRLETKTLVLVMNERYRAEIGAHLAELGVAADVAIA